MKSVKKPHHHRSVSTKISSAYYSRDIDFSSPIVNNSYSKSPK